MTVIEKVIGQDFTVIGNDESPWAKTKEHSSLVINKEKEFFYWNSKGISGGPIDYLMKVKGCSFHEAKGIVASLAKEPVTTVYIAKPTGDDIVVYPELVNIFWENGLNNRSYWYRRGLTDETINRYQLGFYEGWYTLPFFVNGTFRNFQLRREEPTKQIKSWYQGVFPLILNVDLLKITDHIIITEGTVDSLLLNQLGFPAIAQSNGAQYWKTDWCKYFIRQKQITVIYDNDEPGRTGAKAVAEKLGVYRTKIFTYSGFAEKYDTVDFFRDGHTKMEFIQTVFSQAKYAFEVD